MNDVPILEADRILAQRHPHTVDEVIQVGGGQEEIAAQVEMGMDLVKKLVRIDQVLDDLQRRDDLEGAQAVQALRDVALPVVPILVLGELEGFVQALRLMVLREDVASGGAWPVAGDDGSKEAAGMRAAVKPTAAIDRGVGANAFLEPGEQAKVSIGVRLERRRISRKFRIGKRSGHRP